MSASVDGTALVSTHDLSTAGKLRDAFRDAGYEVELLNPGDRPLSSSEPAVLVLTGGLSTHAAGDLASWARSEAGIPVFGIEEGRGASEAKLPLDERFSSPVDPDEVVLRTRKTIERRRLREVTGIVGDSEAIHQALERIVQIAPVSSTVLVTGESGTGKELVARGIHALSPRRHHSFIPVNVAALSDTLLESELFGHEKGAFTGAIDTRKGFFELANKGTIFLDEIGEMPPHTQTKFLRVLEERELMRVGGEKPIRVDPRVIAATNRDLKELVREGTFRRDLYYRLNVLNIELPPLRERRDDIPLLVQAFVREASQRNDRPFIGISEQALEILRRYHWPGNVRELRNLVESMVVLAPGREIRPEDIPDEIRHPTSGSSLLPAPFSPAPRAPARGGEGEEAGSAPPEIVRPQLEMLFRTMVELKLDVEDLRREFDAYRERIDRLEGEEVRVPITGGAQDEARWELGERRRPADDGGARLDSEVGEEVAPMEVEEAGGPAAGPEEEDEIVVYRPGMTIEELEREAIAAALQQEGGNRRRAAESLGIGERTLYRKIKKYDLET